MAEPADDREFSKVLKNYLKKSIKFIIVEYLSKKISSWLVIFSILDENHRFLVKLDESLKIFDESTRELLKFI